MPTETAELNVTPIPAFEDNYIWAIHKPQSDAVIIVDPGDAEPVFAWLQQRKLKLAAVLITHHHADHTGGLLALVAQYPCPVYGPDNQDIAGITQSLTDGERFRIAALDLEFQVLTTPGHTLDHISFYSNDMLFCGDTLFSAGCGRMFEGTPEVFTESLRKLAELPDQTRVYCAHEYTLANLAFARTVEPHNSVLEEHQQWAKQQRAKAQPTLPTTLATEKQINPFLRYREPSVQSQCRTHIQNRKDDLELSADHDFFFCIRRWKDQF